MRKKEFSCNIGFSELPVVENIAIDNTVRIDEDCLEAVRVTASGIEISPPPASCDTVTAVYNCPYAVSLCPCCASANLF